MKLESLLDRIAQNWRKDFVAFVQTGDASPEFLKYLDNDEQAQSAVEEAFTAQARALEGLAQLVKRSGNPTPEGAGSSAEGASTAVARAVERIAKLPGAERTTAVSDAAKTLALFSSAEPDKADTLRSTLSALQEQVEALVS